MAIFILSKYTQFAYNIHVTLFESHQFSELIEQYLSDDEYADLQMFLAQNPVAGDLIQGTGGFRKLRWGVRGRGKRSGVRIIYYWFENESEIWFLTLYAKNEVTDLSPNERKILKQMIDEEKACRKKKRK